MIPIISKEFREIRRDPYTLGVAIILPLALLFLFAYGFNLDVTNIPLAVVDHDQSSQSQTYVQTLLDTEKFDLKFHPSDEREARHLLDKGSIQVALIIPAGFEQNLVPGQTVEVQTLIDGTFPPSAQVALGYIETANSAFTTQLAATLVNDLGLSDRISLTPAVIAEPEIRYNPALESINFVAPGLIAVILMAFPPMLSALAIVREKERGSIQQIFVAPVKPWAFILGKLIPYVIIAFGELLAVMVVVRYWFDVPLAGNPALYILAAIPYVIGTVGIGLLVSTITRSQLVAMLLTIVLTLMPSFLFSGFMFPLFSMPEVLQSYSYAFPARYFTDITYGTWLRGVGIDVWGTQLLALVGYMAVIVLLAALRFQKKVG